MSRDTRARNNVHVTGTGDQTMVFANGFGCDQNMWRFVAPAFEDRYRVVLFDYVGSGKSDARAYDPGRYASLDGYAQDLLDVCDALEVRDAVFVGHSVSCMIGVLASIAQPERFERLVMVGPSPRYLNDRPGYTGGFERADLEGLLGMMEKNFIGWANFLAPVVMGGAAPGQLTAELEESFCSTDPEIARRFAQATFFGDNRQDQAKVTVPSLVLQSADDSIAPVSVGEYVHEHTPGSTLRIVDAQGHCLHMSHPDEIIALMSEYLVRGAVR